MAETRAEAITRLRAEFAQLADDINGVSTPLDATAYDQRIGEWADAQIAGQQRVEAVAARVLLKSQFLTGMAALNTDLGVVQGRIAGNTALTAAELRIGMRDMLQALIWLGDRIADGTISTRE